MPSAGDEGYEERVICPYDKAHEIRRGRMQFHLEKCRKFHPDRANDTMQCAYNSNHVIPKAEIEYHYQECTSSINWDRGIIRVGDTNCPVQDLVPVNAATVPDGDENWDDYESKESVLAIVREQAAEKNILRMMQCESKAKRKNFRNEERLRHSQLAEGRKNVSSSSVPSTSSYEPLPKPTKMPSIAVKKQDPEDAISVLNSKFRTLDLSLKSSNKESAQSEASSMVNEPPSEAAESLRRASPPGTSRSIASVSRPTTATSFYGNQSSRSSTAMSIAASASKIAAAKTAKPAVVHPSGVGFCQVPVPGLGRGMFPRRRTKDEPV